MATGWRTIGSAATSSDFQAVGRRHPARGLRRGVALRPNRSLDESTRAKSDEYQHPNLSHFPSLPSGRKPGRGIAGQPLSNTNQTKPGFEDQPQPRLESRNPPLPRADGTAAFEKSGRLAEMHEFPWRHLEVMIGPGVCSTKIEA